VRDRTQVLHQLVVGHPDARVADDQLAIAFPTVDDDLQRAGVALRLVGQGHVPHLVQRVGRVRDQLPNRDLPALIQRMRQEMQKLLDLGLKRVFLALAHCRHLKFPIPRNRGPVSMPRRSGAALGSPAPRLAAGLQSTCRAINEKSAMSL
jgi:hypothetical protein